MNDNEPTNRNLKKRLENSIATASGGSEGRREAKGEVPQGQRELSTQIQEPVETGRLKA